MSLSFVFGAGGAGKSTHVYRDIIERSGKEPGGRFFIIVPDQFTMQTHNHPYILFSYRMLYLH